MNARTRAAVQYRRLCCPHLRGTFDFSYRNKSVLLLLLHVAHDRQLVQNSILLAEVFGKSFSVGHQRRLVVIRLTVWNETSNRLDPCLYGVFPAHRNQLQVSRVDRFIEVVGVRRGLVEIAGKHLLHLASVEQRVPISAVMRVLYAEGSHPAVGSAFGQKSRHVARLQKVELQQGNVQVEPRRLCAGRTAPQPIP